MIDDSQKLSHKLCNYRQGGQARCGTCAHFTGDGCQIVKDPIAPDGLCDFYVAGGGPSGMLPMHSDVARLKG